MRLLLAYRAQNEVSFICCAKLRGLSVLDLLLLFKGAPHVLDMFCILCVNAFFCLRIPLMKFKSTSVSMRVASPTDRTHC